jgi:hypothetical protein
VVDGATTNVLTYNVANDAGTTVNPYLTVTRNGANIASIASNSGAGSWAHTGAYSATGTITSGVGAAGGILLTSGSVAEVQSVGSGADVNLGLRAKGAGTITLYSPTDVVSLTIIGKPVVKVSAADSKTAQAANVNSPTFYAVPTSGLYRVSAYVVLTQAATTSSTLPGVSVSYTEAITGAVVQDIVFGTGGTTNTVGLHQGGSAVIQAQQGSHIGYITTGYASSGATPMQYAVGIKVEPLQ